MERKRARKVYNWLWFSPTVTVTTFAILWFSQSSRQTFPMAILVFLSGLWHLILLREALNKDSLFVSWHGRQALVLAGVRTLVPISTVFWFGYEQGYFLSIPFLLLIWLGGNLWGQGEATNGDCSLARWFGHEDVLPGPEPEEGDDLDLGSLEDIVRFSDDPEERRQAISKLEELGFVEEL
jgi:hypothetical protein